MYGDPLFVPHMIPARLSVAMEKSRRFKESVNRLSSKCSGQEAKMIHWTWWLQSMYR